MSIADVAFHGGVGDLKGRIARGEWKTAVLDEGQEVPDLEGPMYLSDRFPYERRELYPKTGYMTRPVAVWRMQSRAERALAPGVTGNFEGGSYAGWTEQGDAFGRRPANGGRAGEGAQRAGRTRREQPMVSAAAEQLESAPFVVQSPRIALLVAGTQGAYVRAMHDRDEVARVQPTDAQAMVPRSLELGAWVGQTVRLQIVDEGQRPAGDVPAGIVVDDLRMTW